MHFYNTGKYTVNSYYTVYRTAPPANLGSLLYIKGALDKYNIIPNFTKKGLDFYLPGWTSVSRP